MLKKIDLDLPKWTRDILYEHILEVCDDLKTQLDQKKVKAHV